MKETNKLIAEFDGWKLSSDGVTYMNPQDHDDCWELEDMLFNESWDWLMPVKDNVIPLTDDLPPQYYDMIVNGLIAGDRDQVYNSCVEIIKLTIRE